MIAAKVCASGTFVRAMMVMIADAAMRGFFVKCARATGPQATTFLCGSARVIAAAIAAMTIRGVFVIIFFSLVRR